LSADFAMTSSPGQPTSQRKANTRLAWILASASLVFALGFVAKIWLFSH
jgi:hypothetical protein